MLDADATEKLVRGAQRGDPAAFEGLARAHLLAAYAVALSVVRRPADAEDVAQDAIVRAFAAIETCREPRKFGPWLLVIVRNQARNWLAKRRHRDVPAEEPEERADEEPAPVSTRESLLRALGELSAVQREVVLLHDLEGLTHGEIALVVSCSEGMSRQHLFVARRALQASLRPGTASFAGAARLSSSEDPHAES